MKTALGYSFRVTLGHCGKVLALCQTLFSHSQEWEFIIFVTQRSKDEDQSSPLIQAIVNTRISWFPKEANHKSCWISSWDLRWLEKEPSGFNLYPEKRDFIRSFVLLGAIIIHRVETTRWTMISHCFPTVWHLWGLKKQSMSQRR